MHIRATQEMERDTNRVGADRAWASSQVSEVAHDAWAQ